MPDSGANISAASTAILKHLNKHVDNLLSSNTIPKAANGTKIHPVGKLPISLKLGDRTFSDELHIYPGILIPWKACINLGILPDCYPHPPANDNTNTVQTIDADLVSKSAPALAAPPTTNANTLFLTKDTIVAEFPTVFDGVVRAMDGEKFYIYLTTNAKPFCVTSPRSIPHAYQDKLAAELDSLQQQQIIAPVTEPTDWCTPIVVTPKKNTESIRMCVDLSHLNRLGMISVMLTS